MMDANRLAPREEDTQQDQQDLGVPRSTFFEESVESILPAHLNFANVWPAEAQYAADQNIGYGVAEVSEGPTSLLADTGLLFENPTDQNSNSNYLEAVPDITQFDVDSLGLIHDGFSQIHGYDTFVPFLQSAASTSLTSPVQHSLFDGNPSDLSLDPLNFDLPIQATSASGYHFNDDIDGSFTDVYFAPAETLSTSPTHATVKHGQVDTFPAQELIEAPVATPAEPSGTSLPRALPSWHNKNHVAASSLERQLIQPPKTSTQRPLVSIRPKPTSQQGVDSCSNRSVTTLLPRIEEVERRKQPQSIQGLDKKNLDIHPSQGLLYNFVVETSKKTEAKQAGKKRRTTKTKKCLRCSLNNYPCSGGFPCRTCSEHFLPKAKKHSILQLDWTQCFDSDILQLNYVRPFINYIDLLDLMARMSSRIIPRKYRHDWAIMVRSVKGYIKELVFDDFQQQEDTQIPSTLIRLGDETIAQYDKLFQDTADLYPKVKDTRAGQHHRHRMTYNIILINRAARLLLETIDFGLVLERVFPIILRYFDQLRLNLKFKEFLLPLLKDPGQTRPSTQDIEGLKQLYRYTQHFVQRYRRPFEDSMMEIIFQPIDENWESELARRLRSN